MAEDCGTCPDLKAWTRIICYWGRLRLSAKWWTLCGLWKSPLYLSSVCGRRESLPTNTAKLWCRCTSWIISYSVSEKYFLEEARNLRVSTSSMTKAPALPVPEDVSVKATFRAKPWRSWRVKPKPTVASMVALNNERIKNWKSPVVSLATFLSIQESSSQQQAKLAANKLFLREVLRSCQVLPLVLYC